MAKIEVLGRFQSLDNPNELIRLRIDIAQLEDVLDCKKDELFRLPYLPQILHRAIAHIYIDGSQEEVNHFIGRSIFNYYLLIDGEIVDPNGVLKGNAHFIKGKKRNSDFVAHTVVMNQSQWDDFSAVCEQIENDYPDERDGYTKDGNVNQVIRRGRLLSRMCQERLGGQHPEQIVAEIKDILNTANLEELLDLNSEEIQSQIEAMRNKSERGI